MTDYIESDNKKFLPSRSVVTSGKSVLDVGKNNRTMPRSNKEIKIANESIFKSFKVPDKEFTNYLPRKSDEYENDLSDLLENLSSKKPFNSNKWEMECIEDKPKLERRIGAILEDKDQIKEYCCKLNKIEKFKRKDLGTGQLKGFRFYVIHKDNYRYIILLDPLHFVMPSKKQKQEEYSFKTHQKNNKCMHNVIESNGSLRKFYKQLTSK